MDLKTVFTLGYYKTSFLRISGFYAPQSNRRHKNKSVNQIRF